MAPGESVFVDSGAWIALALRRDPWHTQARGLWTRLVEAGARLHTSIPVILETFTFLDRKANRKVALAWRDHIVSWRAITVFECDTGDLQRSWAYLERKALHKLSAVDATSFAIMTRAHIRLAFAFDRHFTAVGFRTVN